jgi:hypothetical protein
MGAHEMILLSHRAEMTPETTAYEAIYNFL